MITLVLVIALKFGRYVSAMVDSPDREVFLLKLLGAALLVAGIAAQLQVSAAVGAFLLGIAISGSTAERATTHPRTAARPVRGDVLRRVRAQHRPGVDPAGAGWAVGAGGGDHRDQGGHRLVGGRAPGHRAAGPGAGGGGAGGARRVLHRDRRARRWPRASPTSELAALATAYVLLMAILGPIAARVVEPIAGLLRRTQPAV